MKDIDSPKIQSWPTASVSELLCVPYLDTDTAEDRLRADCELEARGFHPYLIRLLRILCAGGLWTQILLWEEWHLDIHDVVAGYGILLVLAGTAFALFGMLMPWNPSALIIGAALSTTGALLWRTGIRGWRR